EGLAGLIGRRTRDLKAHARGRAWGYGAQPSRLGVCSPRCVASTHAPTPPGGPENPVASLDLPPLPGDLARVETGLRDAVASDDQFLADVAAHLVKAGGKRIRPALTLCAAYAVGGAGEPA